MNLISSFFCLALVLVVFISACLNNQVKDFNCNCSPIKLMEGEIIDVDINKNIFKNLLIEKPNKAYVYLQNKSIDSLWLSQKQFDKTKNFKLNTQQLSNYIYYKDRKLKSRIFDRDGEYKIIFTNANKPEKLEIDFKYCKVWFEMWK